MRDLLFFVGGFATCMWFMWGVLKLDTHLRTREGRGGDGQSTAGADATPDAWSEATSVVLAKPQADDLLDPQGAGCSDSAPDLQLIQGGKQ